MNIKDISTLNHEIGLLQGIALSVESNAITDALFATVEILEGIADKLMQEVMGNENCHVF